MNQSKAGRKLNPLIAAQTALIYQSDPIRYKRLITFVWHCQKQGWPDEAIAEALKLAQPGIHAADSWWKYLTSLLKKAKGRATEAESTRYKTEVGSIAGEFIEFLRQKRAR
jgi:hypothetical protein